jgi:hypothetical protein
LQEICRTNATGDEIIVTLDGVSKGKECQYAGTYFDITTQRLGIIDTPNFSLVHEVLFVDDGRQVSGSWR